MKRPCCTLMSLGILLLTLVAGCEKPMPVNAANVTGTWQAEMADTLLVLSLQTGGEYLLLQEQNDQRQGDMPEGSGTGLAYMSGWGKLPMFGTWRVDSFDDGHELVFGDPNGSTVGGATITSLGSNTLTLKLGEKAPIQFTRQPAQPTNPTPPAPTTTP